MTLPHAAKATTVSVPFILWMMLASLVVSAVITGAGVLAAIGVGDMLRQLYN